MFYLGIDVALNTHRLVALKGVAKKDRCQGHQNDPKEPGMFSKLFGKK